MQIISTKEAFHGHRFQNEVISTELDFEFIIITTYLLKSRVLPSQDERERIQEDIPGFKFKKSMLNSFFRKRKYFLDRDFFHRDFLQREFFSQDSLLEISLQEVSLQDMSLQEQYGFILVSAFIIDIQVQWS